jgi:hypothetical protein
MRSMPKRVIPKPCIERLTNGVGCPEYAVPGKSRCEEHQREAIATGKISGGPPYDPPEGCIRRGPCHLSALPRSLRP